MSVLDAFIHDPLVEWEDEKRKMVRCRFGNSLTIDLVYPSMQERDSYKRNTVKPSVDLRMLATSALNPIGKKLSGIYSSSKEKQEKEISTSNLVQMLIQEATNPANLVLCLSHVLRSEARSHPITSGRCILGGLLGINLKDADMGMK
jgi:serine/threonine-protein kinase ATR